jgi:superfamily II DNA or RNA helicase|nr:MAG TPA: Chromatin remodeling complex ATPase [Caudoviricetes sp.]
MTKEYIQEQALQLSHQYKGLILNWATGVGKSRAALTIASEHNPMRILLVVAETAHKKNWHEEFLKWGKEKLWEITTVECYASLKNYRDTEWDIVILDEGHHAKSEMRIDILSTLKVKKIVVLSATLSKDDEELLSAAFGVTFYKFTVTLQEAISEGMLPTPRIYLIPLTLNEVDESETIQESWGDSKKRVNVSIPFEKRFLYLNKRLWPATNLTIKCTQAQKYNYLTDKVNYFKNSFMRSRQEYLKNKWLQLGSMRKRLLAESKTCILNSLLEMLEERRYICFCGSIEQADLLGGDGAIHSRKAGALKTIDEFNNRERDHLVAVNMLQEGQNLKDVEIGIIAQLDGQERAFVQKFGRTLRAEDPIQIILYFKGTRDEEYLNKAIEGIDPDYIYTIETLEELDL